MRRNGCLFLRKLKRQRLWEQIVVHQMTGRQVLGMLGRFYGPDSTESVNAAVLNQGWHVKIETWFRALKHLVLNLTWICEQQWGGVSHPYSLAHPCMPQHRTKITTEYINATTIYGLLRRGWHLETWLRALEHLVGSNMDV